MSRLESVENEVKRFSNQELGAFRDWFSAFEADAWDRQFESDASSGKLDGLAERALRDHKAGKSTNL